MVRKKAEISMHIMRNGKWGCRGGKNRVHGNLGKKELTSGCGRSGKALRRKLYVT